MKQIMVDLETLSTDVNCVILSIGAVVFDPLVPIVHMDQTFYRAIDIQSCIDAGMTIRAATLEWWMVQSKEARAVFELPEKTHIRRALMDYAVWARVQEVVAVWSNGSDFDNAIIANAYTRFGLNKPYPFTAHRCVRTISRMFPYPYNPPEIAHNALSDAIAQADRLIAIGKQYNILGNLQ